MVAREKHCAGSSAYAAKNRRIESPERLARRPEPGPQRPFEEAAAQSDTSISRGAKNSLTAHCMLVALGLLARL